ncbi:hypothetical protein ACEQ8H_002356 [Pleosporales sp. CAS-2024a]
MSPQSRRMQGSIRSSWNDGGMVSEDNDSIYTASESEGESSFDTSDKESDQEYADKATPLLSRSSRAALDRQDETPTNTPSKARHGFSQSGSAGSTPRSLTSSRSTPRSAEPRFIMPNVPMDGSMNGSMRGVANSTPTRNSQLRSRKQSQASGSSPISKGYARRSSKPVRNLRHEDEELNPWWYAGAFLQNVLLPVFRYFWDVFGYANSHFFKPILGLTMGVGILLFGIQLASGLVYSRISTALAPLCLIPGASYVVPICGMPDHDRSQFRELMEVQSQLEEVIDSSKDTSDLPATIKDSELAIRDLRTLVKASRLPSRAQLEVEFDYFVATAKEASHDLSRYNTRIGTVLDRVVATNGWTKNVLQGLQQEHASRGMIGHAMDSLRSNFVSQPQTLEQLVYEQYIRHIESNKQQIAGLIEMAQALLSILTNMDDRLDTIYQLAVKDDESISRTQDELLSQLWTKLGGNQASVKSNARSLNLLRDVSDYRKRALKHVSQTLLRLQQIQSELENLHDSTSAPALLGISSTEQLAYHMELIDRSAEKLGAARGESMRIEHESYRKRLGGANGEDIKELPPAATHTVTVR